MTAHVSNNSATLLQQASLDRRYITQRNNWHYLDDIKHINKHYPSVHVITAEEQALCSIVCNDSRTNNFCHHCYHK